MHQNSSKDPCSGLNVVVMLSSKSHLLIKEVFLCLTFVIRNRVLLKEFHKKVSLKYVGHTIHKFPDLSDVCLKRLIALGPDIANHIIRMSAFLRGPLCSWVPSAV